MPMVGWNPSDGARRMAAAAARPPRGSLWRIGCSTMALAAVAGLALALGFLWFVWRLPAEEITLNRDADGIVVLTGGASRISDAIELLAAGHGRRLLISGANRSTNQSEIARLNPEFARVVGCCVDFDRSLNTLGNAIETRRWAQSRGFRSLIVVTSSYHMQRAALEFKSFAPDVRIIPWPVIPEGLDMQNWWRDSRYRSLIIREYSKYVAALMLHYMTTVPS